MTTTHHTRPWKVFVRYIGPTYSFASFEPADQRARDLTDGTLESCAEVLVYSVAADSPNERWVYRYDEPPRWEDLNVVLRKMHDDLAAAVARAEEAR